MAVGKWESQNVYVLAQTSAPFSAIAAAAAMNRNYIEFARLLQYWSSRALV